MSVYLRVSGGIVAETGFVPPAGFTIGECWPASMTWVDYSSVSPAPAVGWTATQTGGVWTFTAPAAPAQTLAQQAQQAMAAGLEISLSGSMTLTATVFPTDPVTQTKLDGVMTTVNATGAFAEGATTFPMRDSAGVWHLFTVAQYKFVALAIDDFATALDLIIDGNPSATALPAASVALAV